MRDELRDGDDPWLVVRRRVAALAGVLAADFALIGMHQYGAIRALPDLPVRGFDSNAVITSSPAYPFGVPDAAIVVAGCGGLIALATVGGSERTGRTPWMDVALGVGAVVGSAGAAAYLREMVYGQKKLCAYCIAGATGFFAMLPMTVPAATRALGRLARRLFG